jgi:hypothetical protein
MMSRRKREITPRMNERDFPHIVELALPQGGFGPKLDAMHTFHHDHGIESRRGTRQQRNEQEFVRWCFADLNVAADFANRFGGWLVVSSK